MMNGSTSGSVSSYSSTRSIRTVGEIQEAQRPVAALEAPLRLELEQSRDHAAARVEHQRVQGALGARAVGRRTLGGRQLKAGGQPDALAARPGPLQHPPAGRDAA